MKQQTPGMQDSICYLFDGNASSANDILVELLEDRNFHTEIGSNLNSNK